MDPSKHAPLRIHDIRSKYKVVDKVGRGTYGTVFKVLCLQDNKYYAIKKFQNTETKLQVEGFPITALREISLLKQLDHPNIINLKEIICSKPNRRNLYRGSTFLVFQYMHHDFSGLFRHKVRFSMPEIKCIMRQLLEGCDFLHKNKIMHRDIKSANILLNDQGIAQLADFGLGRRTRFDNVYTYKVVTLWYRAPQLLLGCKNYNHKVDVWSLGCVFAEFLLHEVLFKKETQYALMEKIYELCGDLEANEFTEEFLKGCVYYQDMRPKKQYRNSLQAYIKKLSPSIDDVTFSFLKGLLQMNPFKRLSCSQALQHEFFKTQPLPVQPCQIRKLDVQYHEMFRDRSIKIQRKYQEGTNWSEQEIKNQRKQQTINKMAIGIQKIQYLPSQEISQQSFQFKQRKPWRQSGPYIPPPPRREERAKQQNYVRKPFEDNRRRRYSVSQSEERSSSHHRSRNERRIKYQHKQESPKIRIKMGDSHFRPREETKKFHCQTDDQHYSHKRYSGQVEGRQKYPQRQHYRAPYSDSRHHPPKQWQNRPPSSSRGDYNKYEKQGQQYKKEKYHKERDSRQKSQSRRRQQDDRVSHSHSSYRQQNHQRKATYYEKQHKKTYYKKQETGKNYERKFSGQGYKKPHYKDYQNQRREISRNRDYYGEQRHGRGYREGNREKEQAASQYSHSHIQIKPKTKELQHKQSFDY